MIRYVTTGDAVLRYVDGSGLAWRFSDGQLAMGIDPQIMARAVVVASASVSSYGREGYSYRMLDDAYVDDLRSDCDLYARGAESFDSGLAQIMGEHEYVALLDGLGNLGFTYSRDLVCHLALSSADLTRHGEALGPQT